MKNKLYLIIICLSMSCSSFGQTLVFHTIRTDITHKLIPWYDADNAKSYATASGLYGISGRTFPAQAG